MCCNGKQTLTELAPLKAVILLNTAIRCDECSPKMEVPSGYCVK